MNTRRNARRVFSRLTAAAICVAIVLPACERSAAPPPAGKDKRSYDGDYVAALAAADEFCHAWRRGDLRTGKALLSRRVRRSFSESRIRDAIVGAPNPRHAAFEISGGSRAAPGRFVFRVRLFHTFAGQAEDRIEAPAEQIVMIQDASGSWLVDAFPLLVGPGA